jgi:hypothetical protein
MLVYAATRLQHQLKMEKLPAELIVKITSHLSLNGKLSCILVCKQWYEIMSRTNLDNVTTFKKQYEISQALALFEIKKHTGQRVTHVGISAFDMDSQTVLSLIPLLPNITYLNWKEHISK